jgi:hypothetical protein
MIDIYTIWLKDLLELVDEGLPGSLNTQQLKNLIDVIGNSSFTVNIGVTETGFKISSFSLKHNLLFCSTISC